MALLKLRLQRMYGKPPSLRGLALQLSLAGLHVSDIMLYMDTPQAAVGAAECLRSFSSTCLWWCQSGQRLMLTCHLLNAPHAP